MGHMGYVGYMDNMDKFFQINSFLFLLVSPSLLEDAIIYVFKNGASHKKRVEQLLLFDSPISKLKTFHVIDI